MKKTAVLLLVLLLSLSVLSAYDAYGDWSNYEEGYEEIGKRFESVSVRMKGMGGTGLAVTDPSYGFFVNPASLGDGALSLSLPSVSFTLYHFNEAIKRNGSGESLIEILIRKEWSNEELYSSILTVAGTEPAPLVRADAYTSFVTPYGLGLGIYASDTVFSYSGSLINESDFSFTLGYGHAFTFGDFTLKGGVSTRFNYLVFSNRIKAADFTKGNIWKNTFSFAYGWALPVTDIGIKGEWKGLSAAAVLSNLFSSYHMGVQNSTIKESVTKISDIDYTLFTLENRPQLNVGLAYEHSFGDFNMTAALDFDDILNAWTDDEYYSSTGRKALKRLHFGLEAGWKDIAQLRVGISSGYFSAGSKIEYFGLTIESAYYWEEKGNDAGERGLDGLSVRFNLGL